jgi:hypothetical protein
LGRRVDITGKQFGRLTAVGRSFAGIHRESWWECSCVCGNIKLVSISALNRGQVKSCGCLWAEHLKSFSGRKSRKPNPEYPLIRLFKGYQVDAKNRGFIWELSLNQFALLTSSPCHYTGRMPSRTIKGYGGFCYSYNGIDRLDNSAGYTWENCVSCCAEINMMKKTLPEDRFIQLCMEVAKHRGNRGPQDHLEVAHEVTVQ